jgi:hypothetical protein
MIFLYVESKKVELMEIKTRMVDTRGWGAMDQERKILNRGTEFQLHMRSN